MVFSPGRRLPTDEKHLEKCRRLESEERYRILPPERVLDEIGVGDSEVLLDLGCGSGFFAVPAAARLKRGRVIAADIDPGMLNFTASRIPGRSFNLVPFMLKGSGLAGIADASVDIALLAFVLHEVPDRKATLREIHRVLRVFGRIAVLEWNVTFINQGPPAGERISPGELHDSVCGELFTQEKFLDLNDRHYLALFKKNQP
jgi:ubiquinone/menaquinone biosynthesis C-methylase UbiE